FLLTGLSVFILREKDRHLARPFSAPFYPLLPLIFCDTCAYMLFSATAYAGKLALIAFALLHLGLLFYWLSPRHVATDVRSPYRRGCGRGTLPSRGRSGALTRRAHSAGAHPPPLYHTTAHTNHNTAPL